MMTETKSAAAQVIADMTKAASAAVQKRQEAHFKMYGEQTRGKDGVLLGSVFDSGSAIREEVGFQFNSADRVQLLKSAIGEDIRAALKVE